MHTPAHRPSSHLSSWTEHTNTHPHVAGTAENDAVYTIDSEQYIGVCVIVSEDSLVSF